MQSFEQKNELGAIRTMMEMLGLKYMLKQINNLEETGDYFEMNTSEVLNSLLKEEVTGKKNTNAEMKRSRAHLYFPNADISKIIYKPKRELNKSMIEFLSTNSYINNNRSILINAATGGGKTYMSCVFGNCACDEGYSVRYFKMSDLLLTYQNKKRANADIKKLINYVANVDLLILDDFMLTTVTREEAEFLYMIFSYRRPRDKKRSYIICSQLMQEEIYDRLRDGAPSLADAVMDRCSHGAYKINIKGNSMRADMIELDEMELKALSQSKENGKTIQTEHSQ